MATINTLTTTISSMRVDSACKIMAMVDVLLGVAVFFTLGFHLCFREIEILRLYFPPGDPFPFNNLSNLETFWMMYVCSPIQCGLNILLYRGISSEDEDLCQFWQCANLPLVFVAFPLYVRAGFILMVEKFCKEPKCQKYYPEPAPDEDETSDNGISYNESEGDKSEVYFIGDPPPKYETPPPYHVAITMPPATF